MSQAARPEQRCLCLDGRRQNTCVPVPIRDAAIGAAQCTHPEPKAVRTVRPTHRADAGRTE